MVRRRITPRFCPNFERHADSDALYCKVKTMPFARRGQMARITGHEGCSEYVSQRGCAETPLERLLMSGSSAARLLSSSGRFEIEPLESRRLLAVVVAVNAGGTQLDDTS